MKEPRLPEAATRRRSCLPGWQPVSGLSSLARGLPLVTSFIPGLLIVLTYVCYHGVVQNEFVNYDDPYYVTTNPWVLAGWNPASVAWALGNHDLTWHPITWLSLLADASFFHGRAAGFHLTNLLLHTVNVLLIYRFWSAATGQIWASAFIAAAVACHPVNVETVAWISERKGLLSGMFFWSMLLAYRRYAATRKSSWYSASLLLFIGSLMSKGNLLAAPFLLLLVDLWPLRRYRSGHPSIETQPCSPAWRRWWRHSQGAWLLLEKVPFVIIAVWFGALLLITQSGGGAMDAPVGHLEWPARAGNAAVSYSQYLTKLCWPTGLSVFYPHPGEWPTERVVFSLAIWSLMTAAAIRFGRNAPWLRTGWLWYVVSLIPVIGLIQVGAQAMADRYAYVPQMGILVATVGVCSTAMRKREQLAWVFAIVALSAIASWTLLTRAQVARWRHSTALFEHSLRVTPHNWVAHRNLAAELAERGELAAAERHFREAIRRQPAVAFQYDLGRVLLAQGRTEEGIATIRAAVDCPQDPRTRALALARMSVAKRDMGRAIELYESVLSVDPENEEALAQESWILSSCPIESMRNASLAVTLADRLCRLTGFSEGDYLVVLAAAQVAAGQCPQARQTLAALDQLLTVAPRAGVAQASAGVKVRLAEAEAILQRGNVGG